MSSNEVDYKKVFQGNWKEMASRVKTQSGVALGAMIIFRDERCKIGYLASAPNIVNAFTWMEDNKDTLLNLAVDEQGQPGAPFLILAPLNDFYDIGGDINALLLADDYSAYGFVDIKGGVHDSPLDIVF